MKKRIRSAILLTLVLIFLFPQSTGCAPKEIEQTNDSLRVAYFGTDLTVSYPLYEFKQQHPDVEVTTDFQPYMDEDMIGDGFYTRISAEIMSGSGPDIIIGNYYGMNANKMMRSGAFADLNEFLEADPEFERSKYNGKILEAGQVEGKQYIMPLTYTIPLVLTTQELLDKAGFDISTAGNYNAFLEECLKYKQANIPGAPELSLDYYMRPYLADAVDYDTGEVKINTPENRETIRLNYEAVASLSDAEGYGSGGFYAQNISENKAVFAQATLPAGMYMISYRALKGIATPVMAAVRDAEGRLMAEIDEYAMINANSPNKENAYAFLKLLMSDENYLSRSQQTTISISNDAMQSYLEGMVGKEEKLADLLQGDTGKLETAAGLTQEEVDEYMSILAEIDGAYIQEKDVREAHTETIVPYYDGETADLDGCIQNFEDKLKIIASE